MVLGVVTPLYNNPQIVVVLDPEEQESTPIGPAEVQFDEIAQGSQTAELESPVWYELISWRNSILSREQRAKLEALIIRFGSVFTKNPTDRIDSVTKTRYRRWRHQAHF